MEEFLYVWKCTNFEPHYEFASTANQPNHGCRECSIWNWILVGKLEVIPN